MSYDQFLNMAGDVRMFVQHVEGGAALGSLVQLDCVV